MKPDLQLFLKRLTNRSRLNEAEQRAILGIPTKLIQVDANRDFVRLEQIVDHVSVIVEGTVARFGQNAEGERQLIALHLAGDAPDLHTVVVPSDTVPLQALTKATVAGIPHADLRAVVARYPAVAEAFWRHCSVDAAITARWVLNNGRRNAQARIAHLLCEMAVRCNVNTTEREIEFSLPLTQTHLADATGLTAVHVNRSLKALEADGLASFRHRQAVIYDWDRLVERGEFEAEYLQAGCQPGARLRITD